MTVIFELRNKNGSMVAQQINHTRRAHKKIIFVLEMETTYPDLDMTLIVTTLLHRAVAKRCLQIDG